MKKRKTLTECEARYYMFQLLTGVRYLPGKLECASGSKVGQYASDESYAVENMRFWFGFEMGRRWVRSRRVRMKLIIFISSLFEYISDVFSRQVCGTPNYISPEVLRKEGHSSATEAWAIGCIMWVERSVVIQIYFSYFYLYSRYAMLIGKPPFETNNLDATYSLILGCQYSYPNHLRLSSSFRTWLVSFCTRRQTSSHGRLRHYRTNFLLLQFGHAYARWVAILCEYGSVRLLSCFVLID